MLKFLPFSIITAIFLIGCNEPSEEEKLRAIQPLQTKYASIMSDIKENDFKTSNLNSLVGIKNEKSLPAYFGANPTLNYDDYSIKKYNGNNLLFNSFGVDNNVYLIIQADMGYSKEIADQKAQKFGFNTAKDMYDYLFNYLQTKSNKDIFYGLVKLEKNNLISSKELFDQSKLDEETHQIIYSVFYHYFKFENKSELSDKWVLNIDDKKVTFSKDDYKPYALTFLLMNQLLSNNGGINLNGF